ncbi:hypothetical protein PIB30_082000 [Stylosanthes scabra]|uniref:Protein FAR1-RELATED SEQUENCE n=1 Tax=Stylosanthes scabra TaxID=79078 RepID=A0ABU6WV43_9FABA|nr:hypothetical protein [Stylosanthes scabra]
MKGKSRKAGIGWESRVFLTRYTRVNERFNRQSSKRKWLKRARGTRRRKETLKGQIQSLCVRTKEAYAYALPLLGRHVLAGAGQHAEVQAQFRENVNCVATFKQRVPGFVVYDILEEVSISKSSLFEVTYDAISLEVKCECLLFESRGIIYRHSLMVLSYERVDIISPRYILERWSKHIKRRPTSMKSSYDEPSLEPSTKSYNGMLSQSKVHCESASECPVLTAMAHRTYDKLEAEMKEYIAKNNQQAIITHEDGSLSEMNDLQSPAHVRSRGRPKKRLGSNMEKQIASNRKKRKAQSVVEGSTM